MKHSIMLEKILKTLEPTKATSTWIIEAKEMQFPEPHQKCQHIQQLFCNSRGENAQRRETEASDQWI